MGRWADIFWNGERYGSIMASSSEHTICVRTKRALGFDANTWCTARTIFQMSQLQSLDAFNQTKNLKQTYRPPSYDMCLSYLSLQFWMSAFGMAVHLVVLLVCIKSHPLATIDIRNKRFSFQFLRNVAAAIVVVGGAVVAADWSVRGSAKSTRAHFRCNV